MFTFELVFFFLLFAKTLQIHVVTTMLPVCPVLVTYILWQTFCEQQTNPLPCMLHPSFLYPSIASHWHPLLLPSSPLSLPHTAFCPTPLPPTPPPGLAPEHIDFAVYLITAHNLFISPLPKRAAAVTQHTTRGLVQGYLSWDLAVRVRIKIWRKDSRDNNPSIAQKSSCWTCYAQILRKNDISFDVWWRFFFLVSFLHLRAALHSSQAATE